MPKNFFFKKKKKKEEKEKERKRNLKNKQSHVKKVFKPSSPITSRTFIPKWSIATPI